MTDRSTALLLDAVLALASAAVIAWGVLALGWSPFVVMALFWFENVVIGALNVVKILVAGARLGGPVGLLGALAVAAFFTVHYGLFTAVHGMFVVLLFGAADIGREALNGGLTAPLKAMAHYLLAERAGWIAALTIVLLQASGLLQWLVRGRENPAALKELMSAPYGRIVVLHVTLIASGFLVQALHAPVAGALLLVGLKLAYDLRTLNRSRKAADAVPLPAAPAVMVGRTHVDERP